MAWVMDTYSMHTRQATTPSLPASPSNWAARVAAGEATGRGVMICVDKAMAKLGMKKETTRVIIQGFGNVGSLAAELMQKAGYKIIGLADIGGGLYNEKGFDVPRLSTGSTPRKDPYRNFPPAAPK